MVSCEWCFAGVYWVKCRSRAILAPTVKPSFTPPHTNKMAAIMSTSSAFAGVKVQARVAVKSQRAQTVIMANASGPKRVSITRNKHVSRDAACHRWAGDKGSDGCVASVGSSGRSANHLIGMVLIPFGSRLGCPVRGARSRPDSRAFGVSRILLKEAHLAAMLTTAPLPSSTPQGTKAQGGQAGVGYKGSTEAGSAPKT